MISHTHAHTRRVSVFRAVGVECVWPTRLLPPIVHCTKRERAQRQRTHIDFLCVRTSRNADRINRSTATSPAAALCQNYPSHLIPRAATISKLAGAFCSAANEPTPVGGRRVDVEFARAAGIDERCLAFGWRNAGAETRRHDTHALEQLFFFWTLLFVGVRVIVSERRCVSETHFARSVSRLTNFWFLIKNSHKQKSCKRISADWGPWFSGRARARRVARAKYRRCFPLY